MTDSLQPLDHLAMDVGGLRMVARLAARDPLPLQLRLMVNGHIIVGQPAPAPTFYEQMGAAVRSDLWNLITEDRGIKPADKEPLFHDIASRADDVLGELGAHDNDPDELTLIAAVMHQHGSTVHVPALRVPLEAVSAWWLAGEDVSVPSARSTFFVGAMFPTGGSS